MSDEMHQQAARYEVENNIYACDRAKSMADELVLATAVIERWTHALPKKEEDVDECTGAPDVIDRMLSGPTPQSDDDELPAPDAPTGFERSALGDYDFSAHWTHGALFIAQKTKFWIPRIVLKGWVKNEPLEVMRERVAYAAREHECFGKEERSRPAAEGFRRRGRQQEAGHLRGALRHADSWTVSK